jgi:prevent-host-death family protein
MRVVSALDVRRRLGQLLDAASAGERIVIERDRRPLAMLVSYEDGLRLQDDGGASADRALAALERLERFRERMAREHPESVDETDAATLVRWDRSRDDPTFDVAMDGSRSSDEAT